MITILLAIVIFLHFLFYIVIFDIILSWLQLFGVRFRPIFVRKIVDPLYFYIRRYIPTRFGMFDFTPMIIVMLIFFIIGLISSSVPEVNMYLQEITTR